MAVTLLLAGTAGDPDPPQRRATEPPAPGPLLDSGTAPLAGGGTAPSPLAVKLDDPRDAVAVRFRRPPRSGLLFDVDSGRVLWRRRPERVLPIASLTKMMTALVAVDRLPEKGRVLITKQALNYTGSGVGMFKRGRRIPVEHDAARAAAAVGQRRGDRAGPAGGRHGAGLHRADERARPLDGAGLHALLDGQRHPRRRQPLVRARPRGAGARRAARAAAGPHRAPPLGRAARSRSRARKLYLYNNNPLLRMGYRGTTGVKTGYTEAAGRCLVATVRRRGRTLGIVLLDSPDPAPPGRPAVRSGLQSY